jgi:phospholipid/cholesterol/gamma-HCH transport system substrate-binding protein
LYENLRNTSLGLEILIDDFKAHPKRYVNVSVFGKKDKGGYLTSPLPKDTLGSPKQ